MWSRLVGSSSPRWIWFQSFVRAMEATPTTPRRRAFSHYQYQQRYHRYSYSLRYWATPVFLLLVVFQESTWGVVGASSSSCDEETQGRTNPRLRLYLVRHGESAANQLGLYAGQDDVPLTTQGQEQAQRLGVAMAERGRKGPQFWKVYSSDLIRAQHTAAYILLQQQQHVQQHDEDDYDEEELDFAQVERIHEEIMDRLILDPRLRERSYGARQGMPRHLTEEQALVIWKSHNVIPPIYETNEDLWQRGSEWLLDVWKDLQLHLRQKNPTNIHCDDNDGHQADAHDHHVLVVTHAGIIREFLKHLFSVEELQVLGAQWDHRGALMIPNTSVTILEFELLDDDQEKSNFWHTASLLQVADASHLEQFQIHSD